MRDEKIVTWGKAMARKKSKKVHMTEEYINESRNLLESVLKREGIWWDPLPICRQEHGFDIVLELRGGDPEPPHVHVRDLDMKEIGMFLLTETIPTTAEEVVEYNSTLSPYVRACIVEWAHSLTPTGRNLRWLFSRFTWDNQHRRHRCGRLRKAKKAK